MCDELEKNPGDIFVSWLLPRKKGSAQDMIFFIDTLIIVKICCFRFLTAYTQNVEKSAQCVEGSE